MSDPSSRYDSESFAERAERIAKEILKINNLRNLYATLRVELGAIERQYPEWIKELEPLKPREDVFVEIFTGKIVSSIREELSSMQNIIVEERSKLPMGYTLWKPILRINYAMLKKVKKHTFRNDLRIRVEESEKK